MTELLYIPLFIVGLVMLIKGADVITEYSSRIARAKGISEMVIGITLVATATSLPELVVVLTSAFSGVSTIAVGTIIGSNIANIGLVLGISALIAPLVVKKEFLREAYVMIGFSALLLFFMIDGMVWFEGVIIIALVVLYLFMLVRSKKTASKGSGTRDDSHTKRSDIVEDGHKRNVLRYLVYCVIGGIVLVIGGNMIVTATVGIATWFGISELLISMIIIAVGTSLPELAASAVAARKKMRGISLGNIIGSNIFNIMILGISSIVALQPITNSLLYVSLPIMLLLAGLLILFMRWGWNVSRKDALLLLAIYVMFIAFQFVMI
jgi:cation:H+ antiporter